MSNVDHVARVRSMMQGFGQATPGYPMMPPVHERMRCFRLLLEEVLEYGAAAGLVVSVPDGAAHDIPVTMNNIDIAAVDYSKADLVQMVDACADISVVNVGAFLAMGVDPAPVLEEVDKNNLLKIETGKLDPVTGKFKKHPEHPKPNFEGVIFQQMNKGRR